MFKRKRKEMVPEEVKNVIANEAGTTNENIPVVFKDLKCVHEVDRDEQIVRPVIFTTQGNCSTQGLIDLPFQIFGKINVSIASDAEHLLDPMNADLIAQLHRNNLNIIRIQVAEYIRQESFTSFCSAINSSEYANYFRMIPILQLVKERIDNCEAIDQLTSQFFIHNADRTFSTVHMDDPKACNQTFAYASNIALQIGEAISTAICMGSDEAINDIILQVHTIPNIQEFYQLLADDNQFLAQLAGASGENYPTYAAMYLKAIVRAIVEKLIAVSIGPGITNVIFGSVYSNYYMFEDYLYYDYEAAHKQIQERAADLSKEAKNIPDGLPVDQILDLIRSGKIKVTHF